MKIYDSNGWVNWESILNDGPWPFLMMVGPRGTGKTYGIMRYLIEHEIKFVYVRRMQTQLDMCATVSGNPFRKICADTGRTILPFRSGKLLEFRSDRDAEPVAVGCALSTVATVRGFDFSGYDYIVFDECIPMVGEKPIKNEFSAFLNFYETVNRNRELEGSAPVSCIMLGNANQLLNPYYTGWNFTKKALRMIAGRQMVYQTPDRSRLMILLLQSPISARKKDTALYQNANNGFISMAIDNAFRTDPTKIASKPIAEYKHLVSVGEIGIYRHKDRPEYYVSSICSVPYYDDYGIKLKLFRSDFAHLRALYLIKQNFVFETYENELMFREYFNLN